MRQVQDDTGETDASRDRGRMGQKQGQDKAGSSCTWRNVEILSPLNAGSPLPFKPWGSIILQVESCTVRVGPMG